jgi:hypothetical protein
MWTSSLNDNEAVLWEEPVVEFRRLDSAHSPPADRDWALIESARVVVAAKGELIRSHKRSFGPTLFDDLQDALDAMKTWAEENNGAVVYLKEAA